MGCCGQGKKRPPRSISIRNNNPECPACGSATRKVHKYDHRTRRTAIRYVCLNRACKKLFNR